MVCEGEKQEIELEKEKQFLISNGYLADNKPTSKGADAYIALANEVIAKNKEV